MIPKVQQTALMLGLYNRMLKDNRPDGAAAWAQRAVLDEAGAPHVQTLIAEALTKGVPIELSTIMWKRSATNPGAKT